MGFATVICDFKFGSLPFYRQRKCYIYTYTYSRYILQYTKQKKYLSFQLMITKVCSSFPIFRGTETPEIGWILRLITCILFDQKHSLSLRHAQCQCRVLQCVALRLPGEARRGRGYRNYAPRWPLSPCGPASGWWWEPYALISSRDGNLNARARWDLWPVNLALPLQVDPVRPVRCSVLTGRELAPCPGLRLASAATWSHHRRLRFDTDRRWSVTWCVFSVPALVYTPEINETHTKCKVRCLWIKLSSTVFHSTCHKDQFRWSVIRREGFSVK